MNPCNECPFRKKSASSWLGPWTPDSILEQAFSEAGLVCHLTVDAKHRSCVGSIICANKSAKMYRNPELKSLQDELRDRDTDGILSAWEFREHHDKFCSNESQ